MSFTVTPSLTRTRTQLSADFLDLDQMYCELFHRCSREQLLWRPSDGGWSIAECIEHVARGNSQYLPPIEAAIARGTPATGQDYPLRPGGWFSAAFLKRIGPQVTVKFKAPPEIRPLSSVEPEQAFQELGGDHVRILELLGTTAHLDLNHILFKNPFIPILRFTVATGLLIMAAHGRRHLLQAERLSKLDDFPKHRAQPST